jgi:CheY-like chemotaxis protein
MPRMRGSELIRQAQGIRPALPAMLMTGYARLTSGEEEVARLPKPFRTIDLADAVTKLLTGVRLAPSASENDAPYAL